MISNTTILIGISGASASGKSLLANTIVNELGTDQVGVISEDSYYHDLSSLSVEERAKTNFDHPDSLDHDLLIEQLEQLQQGHQVNIPQYDHSQHQRKQESRLMEGHRIVVIEGILLFVEPDLRRLMDIRIYMDTALDVCLLRRLNRDIKERARSIDSVIKQYETTVRPMYHQFIEPSKRYGRYYCSSRRGKSYCYRYD